MAISTIEPDTINVFIFSYSFCSRFHLHSPIYFAISISHLPNSFFMLQIYDIFLNLPNIWGNYFERKTGKNLVDRIILLKRHLKDEATPVLIAGVERQVATKADGVALAQRESQSEAFGQVVDLGKGLENLFAIIL